MGRPRSKLDRHHGNCPCAECVRTFGPPIDYSEPAPVVPAQADGWVCVGGTGGRVYRHSSRFSARIELRMVGPREVWERLVWEPGRGRWLLVQRCATLEEAKAVA